MHELLTYKRLRGLREKLLIIVLNKKKKKKRRLCLGGHHGPLSFV